MTMSSPHIPTRAEVAPSPKDRRRSGRLQMMLIFAVAAAPIVLGTLAFYLWPPSGRTNYGEIQPLQVVEATGQDLAGHTAALRDLRGKWAFVILSDAACAESCRRNLLYTRQIILAQGRDQDRIDRAWLITDASIPNAELGPLYAGARVIRLLGENAVSGFPADAGSRGEIYLIDPLGNLVLRYPDDSNPRLIMKDVQRLLKINQTR